MKKKRMVSFVLSVSLATAHIGMSEVTHRLGDMDGFGVDCPIASGLQYLDYGAYYANYREASDPAFTDNWLVGDQSWMHSYSLSGAMPLSASLELFVAGVENTAGASADVRVGGTSVGAIPGLAGGYDVTRVLTFNVPAGLLTGSDVVLIDVSNPLDGWIIDYSQLTIRTGAGNGTTPIPAPGAFVLGSLGIACVRWMRRRRALQ